MPTNRGLVILVGGVGGLDFFVSNASAGIFAPLQHVQPDHWDRCFRTNVTALHQGSLLAAELMRATQVDQLPVVDAQCRPVGMTLR